VIEDRRPTSEWKFLDDKDFLEIVECLSVGFLLKKSQAQVFLASNLGNVNNYKQVIGMMTIPTRYMIRIIDLRC
jgi:hypothetical protein